jgi:hypothetical protein
VSYWILLQAILDLVVLAAIAGAWLKLSRPAKDDPRLSRGLQLLQSKISVLEDLSDRTEKQASQLNSLMEMKIRDIQNQILHADKQIQKIEGSMSKSLEVARIFQDRIPHQEIIERQNTIKYVKAARLAHQGQSVDEIAQQVDLSRGEIEFIAKVNRDQLQFSEEGLPEWAKQEQENVHHLQFNEASTMQPLTKEEDHVSLSDLGEKFRQAINQASAAPVPASELIPVPSAKPIEKVEFANNSRGEQVQIKKVVFPRVDVNDNLS